MITEDYVSFEVAKLLKEKGFDKFSYYGWDEQLFDKEHPRNFSIGIDDKKQWISCHTHQMAMKWLREVHNLYIEIFVTWRDKIPHYQWRINNLITQDTIIDTPCLEKPEEAIEAALKYTLKNLI